MDVKIVVPPLGESVVEGTITRWLKAEGEPIALDEPLVEIMTDKITMQVPAPAAGTLRKVLVGADAVVPIGTEIGIIEAAEAPTNRATKAFDVEARPGEAPPTPAEQLAPEPALEFAEAEDHLARTGLHDTDGTVQAGLTAVRSSPVVRRLAREHFIDLRKLRGSGRDGRVSKEDVLAYIQQRHAVDKHADFVWPKAEDEELVPLAGVRKAIADHVSAAQRTIPHVTTFDDCDLSAAVAFRKRLGELIEKQYGVHFTFMPFLAKAAIYALRDFPLLNATLEQDARTGGDTLHVKKYVHLGLAVARENSLIVPVVKHADKMNLLQLARAMTDMAARANENRLQPEEVRGGTFTLTNAGGYGAKSSTPIIHAPQVAILGVHALVERPVVRDGQIVARPMMNLAVSFDHRVVDGAYAVQFLRRLIEYVEDPEAWIVNAV